MPTITTLAPKGYTIVQTSHDPALGYPPCPGVTAWFAAFGRGAYGGGGGWTKDDYFLGDAIHEALTRYGRWATDDIKRGRTALFMFKGTVAA